MNETVTRNHHTSGDNCHNLYLISNLSVIITNLTSTTVLKFFVVFSLDFHRWMPLVVVLYFRIIKKLYTTIYLRIKSKKYNNALNYF